ncbi:NAD(P)-dependent oxidoreductase [Mesorhizobium sp. M0491]|uniref:NAD(P)-dependent oxidoreductase n=1 Tax=Mesorhizobium sp. M0491 TaxID=2956950 RepID=UPI00333770A4
MKALCLWHATDEELKYVKAAIPSGTEIVVPEGEYFSRFECTYSSIARHAVAADVFLGWTIPEGIPEISKNLKMLSWFHSGVDDLGEIGFLTQAKQCEIKVANMRVLGVRRNKDRQDENVDTMYGMDDLHLVLAQCDYVAFAVPVTGKTFQLLGEAELAVMKPSALLVNCSRGNLIKERSLYKALTTGRFRGYAADAWPYYAWPRFFPGQFEPRLQLHRLPNVIGSHDQSHNADGVLERYIEFGVENVVEFINGRPPSREVSLDLGY